MGGNPEFQEIRLCRFAGPDRHVELRPGPEPETKVLALLQTAHISTNRVGDGLPTQPTPDRLRWLTVTARILDRKTKW